MASERDGGIRQRQWPSSDRGFRAAAVPPAPLALTLTRPKHGGPQPGQGGEHSDPAHRRAQGVRVQAARHPQFHARTARSKWPRKGRASPSRRCVRLVCGRRLEVAHRAPPPPPLGPQGASRDRLTSLGLRHVAQDPCPYPAPYHPADEKDQVPAPPPHHQDAEGLQRHLQGLVREDLLRLDGCTSTLIVVPPLVVSIIKHESVSSICQPSRVRVRAETAQV